MYRISSLTAGCFVLLVLCFTATSNPALADDKDDIIDRWDNLATETNYFRFYRDGTFKEVAIIGGTVTGKYRFLGKEVIELDTPGVFYGRNVMEVKYKLNGDNLELNFSGLVRQYRRVK